MSKKGKPTSTTDGYGAELWWKAKPGMCHSAVFSTVRRIETNQSELFERLKKLEVLYDPYTPMAHDESNEQRYGGVHENAVASNVDTITAAISTTDVRVRVMTDGADWEQQRRAKKLEHYIEEQNITHGVLPKCRAAFKECAKKGNGLVKVIEKFGVPHVEHVFVENIVVPDDETRDGRSPRQLHEWVTVDADELVAEFPDSEEEILAARTNRQGWRIDGRYFPTTGNQVIHLDSYRLPIGVPGKKGYKPGRHAKTIIGHDLLDEEWGKQFFPYAMQVWTTRAKSWYGIGGAERVAGLQRAINRRNFHIEKQNDNIALPIRWVRPADANITAKTSKMGQIAICHGDYPKTETATAVNGETYQSRIDLRNSASEEFGLSRMATHGTKPAGLDSGVALREFKDQTSDRYSPQEKGFEEDLVLGATWLLLDVCKDLGKAAPVAMRTGRFGSREIPWSEVDMGEVKIQLQVASNLPRTPAGRMQFVIELAQAGVISKDTSTRLLDHSDLEAELSIFNAALENFEQCVDEIAEGNVVMPEPLMNLALCAWRGNQEYLKWAVKKHGAPEDRLELLRQFVVTAKAMQLGIGGPAANANAAGVAQPGAAAGVPPGPGAMPQGPPSAGPPTSAFAPSAMHLVAGTG